MRPQTIALPTGVLQRIEHGWIIRMSGEIAKIFGMPEGSMMVLVVYQANIIAMMNLALQTEAAREKGSLCCLEMPPEITIAAGLTEKSILAIGASQGTLQVNVLPPFTTEVEWLERIWNEHNDEVDVWLFPMPNCTGELK